MEVYLRLRIFENQDVNTDIEFPYQVPDGKWFVLSDVRENTIDSRNSEVGCVSNDNLIGKILFKVWSMK